MGVFLITPVLSEPKKQFLEIARFFLRPCHFGLSPLVSPRCFCPPATEQTAKKHGKETVKGVQWLANADGRYFHRRIHTVLYFIGNT